jgi:multiple sugar transport system substrate-binding protein
MTTFTRRTLVKGGTALAATGALAGSPLAEWSKAWAQTAPWKPERNAQLSLLRWKRFIQAGRTPSWSWSPTSARRPA